MQIFRQALIKIFFVKKNIDKDFCLPLRLYLISRFSFVNFVVVDRDLEAVVVGIIVITVLGSFSIFTVRFTAAPAICLKTRTVSDQFNRQSSSVCYT